MDHAHFLTSFVIAWTADCNVLTTARHGHGPNKLSWGVLYFQWYLVPSFSRCSTIFETIYHDTVHIAKLKRLVNCTYGHNFAVIWCGMVPYHHIPESRAHQYTTSSAFRKLLGWRTRKLTVNINKPCTMVRYGTFAPATVRSLSVDFTYAPLPVSVKITVTFAGLCKNGSLSAIKIVSNDCGFPRLRRASSNASSRSLFI